MRGIHKKCFSSKPNLQRERCPAKLREQINIISDPSFKKKHEILDLRDIQTLFVLLAVREEQESGFAPKLANPAFSLATTDGELKKSPQSGRPSWMLVVLHTKTAQLLSCRNCKFNGLKLLWN